MSAPLCERLHLDPQTTTNTTRMGTAFTVKFDARTGIETGTSAYDRCRSIQVAVDPRTQPVDLVAAAQFNSFFADLATTVANDPMRQHYLDTSFFRRFETGQ